MKHALLIDFSSVVHPIYRMSGTDPNPNATAERAVAKVRALASGEAFVGIAVDTGRTFRHDLSPDYKANRPERDAVLQHQIATAIDTLKGDGFPVWGADSFEADDVLASATAFCLTDPDVTVTVASSDKDLLQLVNERVSVKSLTTDAVYDMDGVKTKLGVWPVQVCDYLCLVGDSADNVKGAANIGPKKAVEILVKHISLSALYQKFDHGRDGELGFTPGILASLKEFQQRWRLTQGLIALRSDAPGDYARIWQDRIPIGLPPLTEEDDFSMSLPDTLQLVGDGTAVESEPMDAPPVVAPMALIPARAAQVEEGIQPWRHALEPSSLEDAKQLAKHMFESRLFSAYGTPQAVLSTILAGRELGLQAMASLRAFHVIDGKPTLSSDLIRATVLKSGVCEYFRLVERSAEKATFVTKRKGDPELSLTYTLDEARKAWSKDEGAWAKSGWGKHGADMLVARASTKLARVVYPDVVLGLYCPEEFES